LNIKLNQKIIIEKCGSASFKRGDAFYRANKVTFEYYNSDGCEATVSGTEDFYVTIDQDKGGELYTNCSCPKLASFQKDCQHVAAVLLSIYEHQRNGTIPISRSNHQTESTTNSSLTNDLVSLFNEQPLRSSGHQLHFENRQVLDTELIFKPITIGKGRYMFGIEIKIGPINVQNIRGFHAFFLIHSHTIQTFIVFQKKQMR
jgi:hypothetical protein